MNESTITIITTLLICVILLSLGLIIKGLIGKRISTDTHCKKCKYNLSAITSKTCPECGCDTTKLKSTQKGLRQKQKPYLIIGLLLLTLFTVPPLYLVTTSINLNPYKPVWLLNQEMYSNVEKLKILHWRNSLPESKMIKCIA